MMHENDSRRRRIAASARGRRIWFLPASLIMLAFLSTLWFSSGPVVRLSAGHATGSDALQPPAGGPYTAVIVETQMTANLVPLMLHFSTVLGPAWKVVLFTLEAGWEAPKSNAFQRAMGQGNISVQFLPSGTELTNSGAVSRFLAGTWLWEQLRESSRVLFFQTDSVVCSKSPLAVEGFLSYDFIGAPIAPAYGEGYNGGLSIRNPSLFLEIARESDFAADGIEFEDQWFYSKLKSRPEAKLATQDVAQMFSVETIYYEEPLGYHQPSRWQADRMGEIEEYCPEVKILLGRRAT